MNSLLNHRGDDMGDTPEPQEREITLGTTMLLGIFFALAVLCAVFFGFGYTMGTRRNTAALPPVTAPVTNSAFSGFKPAPGNPAGSLSITRQTPAGAPLSSLPPGDTGVTPGENGAAAKTSNGDHREPQESAVTAVPPVRTAARTTQVMPVTPPGPAGVFGSGQAVVQIAAVSHQEDADLLISTLKRRGYNVAVHQEPQDKLLHLQIGPFASRKDADIMRQRLLSDGFNAIVK